MALIRAKTRWTGGLRGDGWATPEYYGAKPDLSFDSLPAITAAISDLGPRGAELRFGPWAYRVDGSIPIRSGVSFRGVADATFILGNHATLPLLSPVVALARNTFTEISGIGFGSIIGATGAAILGGQTNQRWLFRNCSWNWGGNRGAPNLNGPIFSDNSSANTGCVYQFEDCWVKSNRDGQVFTLATTGSAMNFRGGKMVWPATTGSAFIYYALGTGIIDGLEFDASAHTTGSNAQCISVSSIAADPILISNVKAFASGGPVKTVLGADSGTMIRCTNLIQSGVNRYLTGLLASGSYLEMLPHQSAQTSGFSYTVPDNISALSLRIIGSPGTAPVITMPAILYPGQEFDLFIKNNSGGNWSQIAFTTAYNGFTGSATNDGFARTFKFKVMSNAAAATYDWMCIGERSPPF